MVNATLRGCRARTGIQTDVSHNKKRKISPGRADVILELVRGDMQCLHEIEAEICRWRDILIVEYTQSLREDSQLHSIVDLH